MAVHGTSVLPSAQARTIRRTHPAISRATAGGELKLEAGKLRKANAFAKPGRIECHVLTVVLSVIRGVEVSGWHKKVNRGLPFVTVALFFSTDDVHAKLKNSIHLRLQSLPSHL